MILKRAQSTVKSKCMKKLDKNEYSLIRMGRERLKDTSGQKIKMYQALNGFIKYLVFKEPKRVI